MSHGTEVGLGPDDTALDWGSSCPSWQWAQQPPSLFGPHLLSPNGRPSQQLLSVFFFVGHAVNEIGELGSRYLDEIWQLDSTLFI